MTDLLHTIKSRVRELSPYTLKTEKTRIKLNQNENPWDAPVEIKDEMLRRLRDRQWSRYPDLVPEKLHQLLAEYSGWTADGIIAGNGSNELIQALLMATVSDGSHVLISEPTFALYRQIATVLGAEIISVPLTPEFIYDSPSLQSAIQSANPDVTIICSPNNPTGCIIPRPDLVSLLQTSTGLVIVDEAYFEFVDETAVPLLEQFRNLVVLRTFSKAMAMAGLRVGYLLAAPELVREIAKTVLPYNLNIVSQIAAEVALEMYRTTLKPQISLIRAERNRLFAQLGRIEGLTPVASRANFMLVRSSVSPPTIYKQLLRRNILIRDVSAYPMLHDCFRVTVGTSEENDQLITALRDIFARRRKKAIRGQSL
ncbi:MAG: histidinol-phosphate transaminase [Pyrinomonadaceae bacterium]